MELPIEDVLRRQFDLASLRREADTLRTRRHWNERDAIGKRTDQARAKEERLYEGRYEARVEIVRQRLVHEAGAKSFDLKPRWAGDDRFAPDATLRQAQREVRASHERRLQTIDEFETTALRDLITRSMRENNRTGEAREAFSRRTDRRSGLERRGGWVRSRNR